MRYATVVLRWDDERIRPLDDLRTAEGVAVVAIRNVSPGPDGRHVELLELRGDPDRVQAVLTDVPEVLDHDVTGVERGAVIAYVRCRTAGLVGGLLATLHDHGIVLDWPIRVPDDAYGLELTAFGSDRSIRRAADSLPADVRFEIARIGEYEPGRPPGALTAHQIELLELAVEEGYYEVPRRTTHRELAAILGLSAGTVSERLQRIESRLVAAYVEST